MKTPSHSFDHLGKTWTLFKRTDKPDAPWYFAPKWGGRGQKVFHCLRDKTTGESIPLDRLVVVDGRRVPAAVGAAMDLITARFRGADQYQQLREQVKLREKVTVGSIVELWIDAGYPLANGRARENAQAGRHAELVKFVRSWWADKALVLVDGPLLTSYAHWRRRQVREGFSGDRIVDREFNTLKQCFDWAVGLGHASKNPFITRPRFSTSDRVTHAPAFMPASDDELHKLCGWLIATDDPRHTIAGAQLLFMALSGLRSGEPGFLRLDARHPDSGPEPGRRFTRTLDGRASEFLAVRRLKGGINPAIKIHPALDTFLTAWFTYRRQRWVDSPFWFPNPGNHGKPLVLPEDPNDPLTYRLQLAAREQHVSDRHAHSMRAFYVRCRLSQGASYSAIAEELGQGSGPRVVIKAYSFADSIIGDGRFDWLPEAAPAAWTLFAGSRPNVVVL